MNYLLADNKKQGLSRQKMSVDNQGNSAPLFHTCISNMDAERSDWPGGSNVCGGWAAVGLRG